MVRRWLEKQNKREIEEIGPVQLWEQKTERSYDSIVLVCEAMTHRRKSGPVYDLEEFDLITGVYGKRPLHLTQKANLDQQEKVNSTFSSQRQSLNFNIWWRKFLFPPQLCTLTSAESKTYDIFTYGKNIVPTTSKSKSITSWSITILNNWITCAFYYSPFSLVWIPDALLDYWWWS